MCNQHAQGEIGARDLLLQPFVGAVIACGQRGHARFGASQQRTDGSGDTRGVQISAEQKKALDQNGLRNKKCHISLGAIKIIDLEENGETLCEISAN